MVWCTQCRPRASHRAPGLSSNVTERNKTASCVVQSIGSDVIGTWVPVQVLVPLRRNRILLRNVYLKKKSEETLTC